MMMQESNNLVVPIDPANEIRMQRYDFFFADRTVKTTISLSKITVDLNRFIRLPIVEQTDFKNDILRIAKTAFVYDRCFHILAGFKSVTATAGLKQLIQKLDKVVVALFRGQLVDFRH